PHPFLPDAGQALVLEHDRGPLLVTGAPGTGKTAVLRERFVRLIEAGAAPGRGGLVVRGGGGRGGGRVGAAGPAVPAPPRDEGHDGARAGPPRPRPAPCRARVRARSRGPFEPRPGRTGRAPPRGRGSGRVAHVLGDAVAARVRRRGPAVPAPG